MKKNVFLILSLCLFALLVAPVLSVAQEDVPDSKDIQVEGHKYRIYYNIKEEKTAPGKLQVL